MQLHEGKVPSLSETEEGSSFGKMGPIRIFDRYCNSFSEESVVIFFCQGQ